MKISDRTYYQLKRLHSLTGVVPIGLFLLEHFYTNSAVLHGGAAFNRAAAFLADIPYVQLVELLGIGVPILFHMALGVVIATTGQANAGRHGYARNWMYLLQRASGLLLVAYIAYHVWSTRLSPEVLRGETDLYTLMNHQLQNPAVFLFYAAGVLAAAFHFGNGLFGFAIHWGIATGRNAQRYAARFGFAVFVVLAVVGLNALLGFVWRPVRVFERAPEPTVLNVGRAR
jgi:succinate dehydrogenase / fumarate reductase cytochrome b subunit